MNTIQFIEDYESVPEKTNEFQYYLKAKREKFHSEIRKEKIFNLFNSKRLLLKNSNSNLEKNFILNEKEIINLLNGLEIEIVENKILDNLVILRKYLTVNENISSAIFMIKNGIFDKLIKFLKIYSQNFDVLYETLWILCNLTYSDFYNPSNKYNIEEIIKLLIINISNENREITFMIIIILNNLAEENYDYKIMILETDFLEVLLTKFTHQNQIDMKNVEAAYALINYLTKIGDKKFYEKFSIYFDLLILTLSVIDDNESLTSPLIYHASWILSYLTHAESDVVKKLFIRMGSKLFRKIFSLIKHSKDYRKFALLRIVCNFLTGDDEIVQFFIDEKILDIFNDVLISITENDNIDFKVEIFWGVSNIVASHTNSKFIQELLDDKFFEEIIMQSYNDSYKVKRELVHIFSNIFVCGEEEQILFIIKKGAFTFLANMLFDSVEAPIIIKILEIIEVYLKFGKELELNGKNNYVKDLIDESNLPSKLVILQNHANKDVYLKVYDILLNFYDCDEELDD